MSAAPTKQSDDESRSKIAAASQIEKGMPDNDQKQLGGGPANPLLRQECESVQLLRLLSLRDSPQWASITLIRLRQAAVLLNVSLRHVRRLIDDGKLPVVMIGSRCPRIRLSELLAYVNGATEVRSIPSVV